MVAFGWFVPRRSALLGLTAVLIAAVGGPGSYEVRLHFAEIYSGVQAVGKRVFDVAIEGVTVLNDYDVFADVGGHRPVTKTFTVTSDATLDIDFGHVTENPAIKAIEVLGEAGGGPGPAPIVFGSAGWPGGARTSRRRCSSGRTGDATSPSATASSWPTRCSATRRTPTR